MGMSGLGSASEVDWNGYPLGSFPSEHRPAARARELATVFARRGRFACAAALSAVGGVSSLISGVRLK